MSVAVAAAAVAVGYALYQLKLLRKKTGIPPTHHVRRAAVLLYQQLLHQNTTSAHFRGREALLAFSQPARSWRRPNDTPLQAFRASSRSTGVSASFRKIARTRNRQYDNDAVVQTYRDSERTKSAPVFTTECAFGGDLFDRIVDVGNDDEDVTEKIWHDKAHCG